MHGRAAERSVYLPQPGWTGQVSMPGDGKRWLSWEKRGDFRIGQKGGGRASEQGTCSVWMDRGTSGKSRPMVQPLRWWRGGDLLRGPRGLKSWWTEKRILPPQGQNVLGEICFLVLLIQHFASSNSVFLFAVVLCLQTATVCLVLVYYFASWWVIPPDVRGISVCLF